MSTENAPAMPRPRIALPLPPIFKGSWRLFQLRGVDVHIHWSWFLVALLMFNDRPVNFSSPVWDIVAYLASFAIILLHEFGHVFACRSVGGMADRVLLWPLGGLAFAFPPPRPGATLWTIAAGPLVNVFLAPILFGLMYATDKTTDIGLLFESLAVFNLVVLVFNLFPVFPLDGGQILNSLLWFVLGRVNALVISATIGFLAAGALLILSVSYHLWWLVATSVFLLLGASGGIAQSRRLKALQLADRRESMICPDCQSAAPIGPFWQCGGCQRRIDMFEEPGLCPRCRQAIGAAMCADCGKPSATIEWISERRTYLACPHCRSSPPVAALWQCGNCKANFDTFDCSGMCPNCHIAIAQTICPICSKTSALDAWQTIDSPPQSQWITSEDVE